MAVSKIAFVYTFDSDSKTIIKDSEASGYPATNVQDYRVAKKWRSNNVLTNAYVGIDNGAGDIYDFFLITGHNLTSGATIKVQGANDAAFTDIGVDMTLTYHKNYILKYDATGVRRSNRYWRFLFTDASNPNGYIEVGRMIMAKTYKEPTDVNSIPWNIERVDPSPGAESESQSSYFKLKTKYKQITNLGWASDTATDTTRDELITIWDAVGLTEEVVCTVDPVNDLNESTIYGRLTGFRYQKEYKGRWTIDIPAIREAL